MISPEGEEMCRCALKRAKWYIDRGLADVISEDPPTIKLKFKPHGNGNKGDAFSLAPKHNRCVKCGTEANLTKHHIVPYMYRKFFPLKLKARSAHDVVVICVPCHEEYETEAMHLKKQISIEFTGEDLPVIKMSVDNKILDKVCRLAKSLLRKNTIPASRQADMMAEIVEYLGKTPTLEELEELSDSVLIACRIDPGKAIVEDLHASGDFEPFIKRWRQHFIDTAKPAFMPEHWSVDREVDVL
jgi:hypothetical protein